MGTEGDRPETETQAPAGALLDRDEAARWLGVNPRTLREWIAGGLLPYGGLLVTAGRRRRRAFDVAKLDQAREQMRAAVAARAVLPEGYISREETAALLGIGPDTLALWHTHGKLRCGMWVKNPEGKRSKIYPRAEVERLRDQMTAADEAPIPEGFVDRDTACRMFGVCRVSLRNWERAGKVHCGRMARRGSKNRPYKIYAVEELRRLVDALRGEDATYIASDGSLHVPEGYVGSGEACRMFGVHYNTWDRWERLGWITCGRQETGRRIKIYPRAELERLVAECGRYSPPYPDPDRPGVYRVPLGGYDMKRSEALIDAADAELLEGRSCHFSFEEGSPEYHGQVVVSGTTTRLHQLVLGLSGHDLRVGHLNADPLDCRRENLVVRTHSQAGGNMRKARLICGRPPTSRFKGVCLETRSGKWKAYIKRDQVMRNIGTYRDEIAAAEAYDEAARELFGEHARLNFPDGVDAFLASADNHPRAAA
jgi:predicted site-specific integrase-resolvase